MKIEEWRINKEINKRSSKEFVMRNKEDIFQQSYVNLLEGETDYEKAVERAIWQVKKEITNPRLINKTFINIDLIDIAIPEEKPVEIVLKPITKYRYKTMYKKIRNLQDVAKILEKLGFDTLKIVSTNGKYIEGLQVKKKCPVCGNESKPCFSIYRRMDNGKSKITYSCQRIPKGDHYKKYPNNLEGIFNCLIEGNTREVKKKVLETIKLLNHIESDL